MRVSIKRVTILIHHVLQESDIPRWFISSGRFLV
jgi:hypothetical protein